MGRSNFYTGLDKDQVEESRKKYGANILTPPVKESLFRRFLGKFQDPLIVILLIAGALSILISIYEYIVLGEGTNVFFEPVGIFMAIFLATGLAFFFELKADREFEVLNQVNDEDPVQVIRSGMVTEIPKKDVVVDDIVILNTGNEVPADGKLLEAVSLNVDESTLTGETICGKSVDPAGYDDDATFPSDHVMRGTKVMEGHGIMRVFAVGDQTENGKVYVAAQIDDGITTPLGEQLDHLGRLIAYISYAIGGLVIAGRLFMYFTSPDFSFGWLQFAAYFLQTMMVAVTLVVVAVPEGLPMAVTLSLAYSMRRMLRTNNLVRKMHACETMGATTVICTDKTGTLTRNRMQVNATMFYGLPDQRLGDDPLSHIVAESIAVNSTAVLDVTDAANPRPIGNPTEGALLLWLATFGIDYRKLRENVAHDAELPFTTERKYMASVISDGNGHRRLYVKGAPEIIYGMCSHFPEDALEDAVDVKLLEYQNRAMRTLGFAYADIPPGYVPDLNSLSSASVSLNFLGFVAISDPVRDEVPDAVREVFEAGIDVKIVTGDTPGTACEIGRQIGLWKSTDSDRNLITGNELAALSDTEFRKRVGEIKIIARARPMDKRRLVEALQSNNEVVAVTGDGTNDAPALKAAHVGLSMGDGTAVAKEASDITIIDNSFSSIGRAVMWGRSLYRNIQRFILFQTTVNVAACLIVLAGSFMGTESPLTVTQMLWVNLIMDTFAAMALASLPPSRSVMRERPRSRNAFIIDREMWWLIICTGVIFFGIMFCLLWYFKHTDIQSLLEIGRSSVSTHAHSLTPYELSLFFTVFVFLQFWNMFNARAFATGRSALHFKDCGGFVFIAVCIFAGQILIVEFGRQFFNVIPLRISDWIIIICGTSVVLWAGELLRLCRSGRGCSNSSFRQPGY